jgi:hypothetical protein
MGLKNTYQTRKRFSKVPVDKTGMWYQDGNVVVPSNQITMKGPNGEPNYFNSPIMGIGMQSGQTQVMQPGREYFFPNDNSVYERKMQSGGLFPVGPYDEMMAPKQGNYLQPDINRPSYIDDFGGMRSEYRMGFNSDGKETLIPTVVQGRQLSEDEAIDNYYRTGLHMGKYDTVQDAENASRLRTAKYNMFQDPVRFNMNEYQYGGETSTFLNPDKIDPVYINYKRTPDESFVRSIGLVLDKLGLPAFLKLKDDKENSEFPLKKRESIYKHKIINPNEFVLSDSTGDPKIDYRKKEDLALLFEKNPVVRDGYQMNRVWNYYKDYMSSPRYAEMLQSKSNSVDIDINRAKNLQKIQSVPKYSTLPGVGGYYDSYSNQITLNPDNSRSFTLNDVIPHELSHSTDVIGNLIPKEDLKSIKDRLKPKSEINLSEDVEFWKNYGNDPKEGSINYLSEPTEVRARLNTIRYNLYNNGVDVFNKHIKKEDLNNLNIQHLNNLNDLKLIYKDDDLLWLLNNISKNDNKTDNVKQTAKHGGTTGWLDSYQDGGETSTADNPVRMNPIEISAKRKNQDYRTYQDNTVNNNQIVPSEFRGRRYVQPTLSEYVEPSIGNRILNTLASPMTALSNNRTGSRNPFDYALDMVNPFSWIQSGERAVGSLSKGQYEDAALNALGALPALGFADDAGRALSKAGNYATTQTPLKNAYKYNPLAFKADPKGYYRVLGKEGLDDAFESGVIRANQKNLDEISGEPFYDRPYFSKSVLFDRDYKSPFKNKKGKRSIGSPYPDDTMVEVFGDSRFYSTDDLVTSPINTLTPFDEGVNFYKRDWLQGYKKVNPPKPQKQNGGLQMSYLKTKRFK